jgi:hypothetical protein
MKKTTNTLAALAFAGVALLSANAANASCGSGFVKLTQVFQGTTAVGTPFAYAYGVPEHYVLPSTVYYFYTNDTSAITQLFAAEQNHESIFITGNATSCPTTGTYLFGGTIQYIYDY